MTPLPFIALLCLPLQPPVGPPRWFPESTGGLPIPAAGAPLASSLRELVKAIKALPHLTPPPGVYPRATLGVDLQPKPLPHKGSVMLGFWTPSRVALRGGTLISTSAITNLMIYVNFIREGSLAQDTWMDDQGTFMPEPKRLGDVQGFPVYKGFGGSEVSGILVIQPQGRSLFAPISQERFHKFAIAQLEKRLKDAQLTLVRAQQVYAEASSPAGKARRAAQLVKSLEDYKNKRPRTPEQLAYREKELARMDAEELERLRIDATPEGNRLTGYLSKDLAEARAQLAALTPDERAQPAWHLPNSRNPVAHPVAPQTPGATPVVTVARWANPALPRTAPQLISVERYWMSAKAVHNGLARTESNLPYHLNTEVIEALDWKAIAQRLLR
jgi:hypothetical protein